MGALENLTSNFSLTTLDQFFRGKIPSFKPDEVRYDFLFDDNEKIQESFTDIQKLGEADLPNGEDLFVITAMTKFSLTERSSKKQQYDIAKKLLKEEVKDAAFFIFFDDKGQFRFSFIRADFKGTRREYTTFRRYTYYVSPSQTNQTFIRQLSACNFQDLEEIQNAFSVEPLNKEFYQKIAKAFYQLIGGKVSEGSKAKEYKASLRLPSLDPKNNHRTYQEFAVRFIGRTIFIWFLKNKTSNAGLPLIPSDWLTSVKVGLTNEYYHNLLEKLFFEILNTPIGERKEGLPEEHTIIPFLNGGLFEPQHDDFYEAGFNGFSKYYNTLQIPDSWIENLFETLEQFNFTIDENTLTDMEVSIDPEMLGTIFENLLAEIDPDTEKSARKSTGSFYTPREIVEYMVVDSLVSYLEAKTGLEDSTLRSLFSDSEIDQALDSHREQLINAFDSVKILDPACGSGAFPMGALHKINIALQKLDPDAEVWKEKQLAKVENVAYRKALKDKLDKSNVDYVRKIGIIQHSIYGVDIQPIATEISKLRSFLSLVVDENIEDKVENRGIYPLPNLEFKFVTANTLVRLKTESVKSKSQTGAGFDFSGVGKDIEALQETRDQYLQSFGQEKEMLKERFLSIQKQIAQKEFSSISSGGNVAAQQIIGWNPFSHEKSAWFDPKWMYGVEGFDIVLGNPPYVDSETMVKREPEFRELLREEYSSAVGNWDLFIVFIERGINLCRQNGVFSYIIPNKLIGAKYAGKLRSMINVLNLREVRDYSRIKVFIDADVYPITMILKNRINSEGAPAFFTKMKNIDIAESRNEATLSDKPDDIFWDKYFYNPNIFNTILKIARASRLSEFSNEVVSSATVSEAYKLKAILSDDCINSKMVKFINTGTIDPYISLWGERNTQYIKGSYVAPCVELNKLKKLLPNRAAQAKSEKIVIAGMSKGVEAYHDSGGMYLAGKSTTIILPGECELSSLTALLNSKLISFYIQSQYHSLKMAGGFLNINKEIILSLPIPEPGRFNGILSELSGKVIKNIDNLTVMKALMDEIDGIVYRLYDLDYEEIFIIDPHSTIRQNDYRGITIE